MDITPTRADVDSMSRAAARRCRACRDGRELPFKFTMAFQPIVDVTTGRVWAYEALVRGLAGESAGSILAQLSSHMTYGFDQACRVKAVELASWLFPTDSNIKLSINFMPNAVYEPTACISATLAVAARTGFDPRNLMFEFTEEERMQDVRHVRNIIGSYRNQGFTTAIDDFGAGYSGLEMLAKLTPDILKIDIALIRGIHLSAAKRAIVRGVVTMCAELGVVPLAEGIETLEELEALRMIGIRLCQGYFFARPALESLPSVLDYAFHQSKTTRETGFEVV